MTKQLTCSKQNDGHYKIFLKSCQLEATKELPYRRKYGKVAQKKTTNKACESKQNKTDFLLSSSFRRFFIKKNIKILTKNRKIQQIIKWNILKINVNVSVCDLWTKMSWLNNLNLNTIKGQLTNLANEILEETAGPGDDEYRGDRPTTPIDNKTAIAMLADTQREKEELDKLCSDKEMEVSVKQCFCSVCAQHQQQQHYKKEKEGSGANEAGKGCVCMMFVWCAPQRKLQNTV